MSFNSPTVPELPDVPEEPLPPVFGSLTQTIVVES